MIGASNNALLRVLNAVRLVDVEINFASMHVRAVSGFAMQAKFLMNLH